MSTNDWERIRHDQPSQDEGWVPEVATNVLMWAEGETPIVVSVRRKGESDIPVPSGDPQKVSLKIDINDPVAGQKWRGLTKLSLENGSGSPVKEGFAWIAQRLAWEGGIYGYEAAYSGWVKLYINGDLKGVFVNAEQRNAQFLKNHGYDKGPSVWLYKVDGSSMLEVGEGHSPAYQHLCYSPFSSGPGGGGGGCTQPDLEADLPQWVDIRGLFTFAAVEAFLENQDSLFLKGGKNSYAVDFNPPYPRTRLYFPWDQDTVIFAGNGGIYNGGSQYVSQLLQHPWYGKVYEQLLRDLTDGPFSLPALHAVIDRLQTNLGPALLEDPYFVYDDNEPPTVPEIFDGLRNWVTARVPNVRSQLTQPYLPRPVFNQMGGEVVAGFNLTMSAPAGMVYYTLDGTDPRAPGGALSPSAVAYSAPVIIDETTHVIARAHDGSLWSPMPVTATFNIARYASALRITEVMYHPATQSVPGDEDNFEFVELKNTGGTPLHLSGFYFEGITYAFPPGAIVQPGSFYVLVRNASAFTNRYPAVAIHGVYTGNLDDGGEKIRLRNSDGNTILSVEYDDDPPWALSPDGLGYSLVLAEPFGDPDHPDTWRASGQVYGSPGADDPAPAYGLGIVINEVLSHVDPPFEDAIELYNTSASPVDISGWYLSDDFVRTNATGNYDLKKYRVPSGTVIPAGGFKVFYQRDFDAANPLVPFALSEFGETVYLAGATTAGTLNGYLVGARFGASERGVSLGRYSTSQGLDFVPLARATFGADNPASLSEFRTGTGRTNAAARVGPVVINEIMYNPAGGGSEFIELLNITNVSVDLSGWTVAGADFTFPLNSILPAQGLVLILKTNTTSASAFRSAYSVPAEVMIFAHDFVLENEGEALRLEEPNAELLMPAIEMERVRYNDKSPWPTEADGEGPSLERFAANGYGNDPINWRTVSAGGSPGRANLFNAGVAVVRNSSWQYHAFGSDLGAAWREVDYPDSGWPGGDGVFGYGAIGLGTLIPYGPDAANKPMTVYFRKEFVINDPLAAIGNLRLEALYDDGFVVHLNGAEVIRSASMPSGVIGFNTPAESSYNSLGYETFDLSPHISGLRVGNNVLCVEVHQDISSSEDLLWDASLTFDVSTQPTVVVPTITPNGGPLTGPVLVAITTTPADANIYYTLNGTDPDESSLIYTGAFLIQSSAEIRARAFKAGYNESPIATAVFTSPAPGVLDVTPGTILKVEGTLGGPFAPATLSYVLTNAGGMPLTWSASASQPWLTVPSPGGTLASGALTNVLIAFNSQAEALPVGKHSAVVTFADTSNGADPIARSVELIVTALQISAATLNGQIEITLRGQSNAIYAVDASTNLLQWAPIHTNAAGPNGIWRYVDLDSLEMPHRFYRGRKQ